MTLYFTLVRMPTYGKRVASSANNCTGVCPPGDGDGHLRRPDSPSALYRQAEALHLHIRESHRRQAAVWNEGRHLHTSPVSATKQVRNLSSATDNVHLHSYPVHRQCQPCLSCPD